MRVRFPLPAPRTCIKPRQTSSQRPLKTPVFPLCSGENGCSMRQGSTAMSRMPRQRPPRSLHPMHRPGTRHRQCPYAAYSPNNTATVQRSPPMRRSCNCPRIPSAPSASPTSATRAPRRCAFRSLPRPRRGGYRGAHPPPPRQFPGLRAVLRLALRRPPPALRAEQTKEAIRATAQPQAPTVDLPPWLALHSWLEGAEHRVAIPFAADLAERIPPVAVRLRRDFGQLLALIRAHAILH